MGRFEAGDILSFGGWIESRRRAMNLTRNELAQRVGCAAVTIKKIERDERRPSVQMAELLAAHLAIPQSEIEKFMRMARGTHGRPSELTQPSLRIPPFLEQGGVGAGEATIDFVERRKELARLEEGLEHALAGRAAPLFLLGGAGSGKTSLLREFARLAPTSQPAHAALLIAAGQCNAQTGPGDAFRPFRDILGILTGDLESDWTMGVLDRPRALQIWAAVPDVLEEIASLGPHLLDTLLPLAPLIRRIAPYVVGHAAWFQHLQDSAAKMASKPGNIDQGRLLDELTEVLRAVARKRPLILMLDDLQWADRASLNALFHLSRRLAGSRVLIVGAHRTDDPVATESNTSDDEGEIASTEGLILELTRQHGEIQIRLDQASPMEGRAFIDAILDQEPNRLGEAFREDLQLRTRGHALFTVEMLQSMRQNQEIVRDGEGYWVENPAARSHLRPARVEAVIAQRLARLNTAHRQLLEAASVQGEGFIAEVAAKVLELDLAAALGTLTQELGRKYHLAQEQGPLAIGALSLNRFQFQHMLVQEHLYGGLEESEKRRLHRRTAEELEKILLQPQKADGAAPGVPEKNEVAVLPQTLDSFGPALLHHFESGEAWSRAAAYAYALGGRARQRYAMRESIAYYERALKAMDRLPPAREESIVDVLLAWVDAAFNFKHYEAQLQQLARAEEIARRLQDKPRLIEVLHWTANVLLAQGRWTLAGAPLTEALALSKELGNEELSVRPVFFKALLTSYASPAESLEWIERAELLSHKHNDGRIEATALAMEAYVLAQLGNFEGAQEALQHGRQVSGSLGSPLVDSDVDLFAALTFLSMGRGEQALEFAQRSVETAIATDNMDCICTGLACLGYTNLEVGRLPQALEAFQQGIERSDLTGALLSKLSAQAGLAVTRFMTGHAEAIKELEGAIAQMSLHQNHVGAANASQMLGLCFLQLGRFDEAATRLREAVEFYRGSRMTPSQRRTLQLLADAMEQRGQSDEANAYRRQADALAPFTGPSAAGVVG